MAPVTRKALFLRDMPVELIREAKAIAARRGQTLTSVVADALARSLTVDAVAPPVPAVPDNDGGDLERDMIWFAAEHATLARRHAGEYVAIVDRAVVDHDRDFDALARRVFATHGRRSIYIPRVADQPVSEAKLRSPRRVAR